MKKFKAKYYIIKGIIHKLRGNLIAAITDIQHGLKLASNQPVKVYTILGNLYLSISNNMQAKVVFDALVEKYPDSEAGYIGLALIAQNQEDWGAALKYWDMCLAKNKVNIKSWWLVKKASALLELGHHNDAEELFLKIQEKYPDEEWGYLGLVHVASKQKGTKGELEQLERLMDKYPDRFQINMRYGVLLRQVGRYEEAETCFLHLKDQRPNDRDVLCALFWTARTARQYDVAIKRSEELIQKFPGNDEYVKMHLHALLDTIEYDRAQIIFDRYRREVSDPEYLIMQAVIYWEKLEEDKALEEIEGLQSKYPNNVSITLRHSGFLGSLFRDTNDSAYLHKSLKLLENLGGEESNDERVKERLIEVNILLGQKEIALRILSGIPDFQSQRIMELKAWAYHIQGNEEGAKKIWQLMQDRYYLPHIQFPAPGVLKPRTRNPIETEKDSILVFTAVRNERWRLPWFLEYYRNLGVDRFFFVDNNSTDGTAEYLQKQEDVFLFWTDQNYAKSYSGMQWVNWLAEEYGTDCWCIYVDVDEAMIFPGIEKRNLKSLTSYMAANGHEAMYAFMLDMYEPGFKSKTHNDDYMGFMEDYTHFENYYFWINSTYCPYKYTAGGIRRKLEISENQTKTPIIRGGRGIKFLMSSHRVSPAILTDVSGVLLHYKLSGDFKNTFAADLTNNTRMPQCKRRHWGYLKSMDNLKAENDNSNEKAVLYQSSQQLVKLGLIKTSVDFENKTYD